MNEQAGRIALVTGAARGIGKAISMRLGEDGAHVLVTDIDQDAAARTAAEMTTRGFSADAATLDVTDAQAVHGVVDALHAKHGRIDILVSNAGAGKAKPFLEVTEDELAFQMSLNFAGVYAVAQACARKMRAARYGRIVLVSSVTGLAGPIELSAYGAMKAGQFGLMRAMALELAEHGITTNAVAPGPIDTELLRAAWPADMVAEAAERIPVHRLGKPEDVAHAVGFLASPHASFLNGVTIAVDGGFIAAGGYMAEIYRRRKAQQDTHPEPASP
ncbi:3-oxoacyl-[acyl-carrier protein] reductase [Burkholderia sp. PvR073]|uniref:SDR family NAD(P)-dependent oxidoreductase n=1 Tax=Burkholderia TaxID=32008 RepID=UPI00254E625B|nr:SDR family NAD(P)-dependent oxidoreductase [Burkholderia sp. lyk4-R2A-23]